MSGVIRYKEEKFPMRNAQNITIIFMLIFGFIRYLKGGSIEEYWCILFAMDAVPALYDGFTTKRKSSFIWAIIMSVMTVVSAVLFFK